MESDPFNNQDRPLVVAATDVGRVALGSSPERAERQVALRPSPKAPDAVVQSPEYEEEYTGSEDFFFSQWGDVPFGD